SRLKAHLAVSGKIKQGRPIRLRLRKQEDGYQLVVDESSVTRLREDGIMPVAKSLSASMDVAPVLVHFLAHAIAAFMGRDLHELVARGGVQVADDAGNVVWERLPPS